MKLVILIGLLVLSLAFGRRHRRSRRNIFDCKGVAFEAYNTKTGKVARAAFKNGEISGDVCLDVDNGKVYTKDGKLADNLVKRLCDQGHASYLPAISAWKLLSNNYLVFCKAANPGPMKTHNGQNFCNLIKIDLGHGKKFVEWLSKQPAKCQTKLDQTVANQLYQSARRYRRHH